MWLSLQMFEFGRHRAWVLSDGVDGPNIDCRQHRALLLAVRSISSTAISLQGSRFSAAPDVCVMSLGA